MHPNFYHWHARAELKPDSAILESRWNAAAKFAENLTAPDIYSLLRLAVFPGAEPEFAKRFTEELVKAEPTFSITNNAELLRVMAAAAIYSRLETSSTTADAFALGLRAAEFPKNRIEPVCQDVMTRAAEYLVQESEAMRPAIDAALSEKVEKQVDNSLTALKTAVGTNQPQTIGNATEALGRSVAGALKESHQHFGKVIDRLTEETQFLWWLIGRRSPSLDMRRDQITPEAYALPAATEAAERVTALPPAASVESLLSESLSQCKKSESSGKTLADLVRVVDINWAQRESKLPVVPELTPLTALLSERQQSGKPDGASLKKLKIPIKMKLHPAELAQQYFRERMFLRAMESV